MAEVGPSGRTIVRNSEPTKPACIRASQAHFYLSDVLVPCVADHFGEQEDLVLLPKCLTKTVFVYFKPMILHGFALFCPMYGRVVGVIRRGHPCFTLSAFENLSCLIHHFLLVCASCCAEPSPSVA